MVVRIVKKDIGVVPKIKQTSSFQNEIDFIIQYLNDIEKEGASVSEICLVARTHDLLNQYESALKSKGIDTYFIRRSEAEDRKKKGIRLATMHRVKGLEFDRMIIAGVNDGVVPLTGEWMKTRDAVIQKDLEMHERALLYVSVTRAKKEVVITSFGKVSPFLGRS
jgi:superfamily I DNA/RNA helicase